MQQVLHYSALQTGAAYLTFALSIVVFSGVSQAVVTRIGIRRVLPTGLLVASAGLLLYTRLPVNGHYFWDLFPAFLIGGIGFAFAAMATLITEAVRPTETGVATGMNTVMRTVGGVIGGQVGAALLAAHTVAGTHGIPSVVGFEIAFAISAVAALVGASVAVFVTPPRLRRRERLVVATTEVVE